MDQRIEQESLAEYVRRVRVEKNLSQGDVERESARRGNKIAGTYVSRIESEIATNPSPKKLSALALGLGRPEDEVFAVARGKSPRGPDTMEEQFLSLFRELPPERKDDLMGILEHLHSKHAVKPGTKKKRPRAA